MSFTQRERIIIYIGAVLCLIFLSPCLLFPISPDLSLFALGGQVLLDGGAMYADFVDIKPPLIFYVLALAQFIFGEGEVNVRLFDFVWQLGTIISIFVILRRHDFSTMQAASGGVLYSLAYTVQHYSSTMQCEGLAALPLLWATHWYLTRRDSGIFRMLVGFLVGAAFCLKFTLGVVLVPFLLSDIFFERCGFVELLKRWLTIGFGFVLAVFLLFVALLLPENAMEGYRLMVDFTVGYVGIQQWNMAFMREALRMISHYFGDNFSFFILSGLAATVLQYFRRVRTGEVSDRWISMALLVSIFLFLTVVLEKKLMPYHYGRMHVFLIPLAAIGLLSLWHFLRDVFRSGDLRAKTLVVVAALTLVVFSPLTRFVNILRPSLAYFVDSDKYDQFYERGGEGNRSMIRQQQMQVVDYVKSHRAAGDRTFVVSTQAGPIYFFLDEDPLPKFPSTQFYSTPMSPPQWVNEFAPRLAQADWLIVATDDRFIQINATDKTAVDVINDNPDAAGLVQAEFHLVQEFPNFLVYKRN